MEHGEFVLPATNMLSPSSTASEIRLRSGEVLVRAGMPLLGVITVRSGRLKRCHRYGNQDFLVGLAGPGESVGWSEALESRVHRETLQAIGETTVVVEPLARIEAWLATAPAAFIQTLRGANPAIRHEEYLRRPLDLMPVRARVAATLWLLALRHGAAAHDRPGVRIVNLGLTREEVAHLAGTVYESVIRTLTALKKEGVIDLEGRVIRILKEDQLARIGQIVVCETHDQNTVS